MPDDERRKQRQQQSAHARLDRETAEHYDCRSVAEVEDDAAWAEFAARAARRLLIDDERG